MHNKKTLGLRAELMTVLQEPTTNLLTIAVVCDAIAADARFNTWVASIERRITVDQFLELLRDYERLADRCSLAIAELREEGGNANSFREVIQDVTHQLSVMVKERFR